MDALEDKFYTILSLQDYCLLSISKKPHRVFNKIFLEKNTRLPPILVERIFRYFSLQTLGFPEKYLQYFSIKNCNIQKLHFDASLLTNGNSMNFLKGHSLKEIHIQRLKACRLNNWLSFVDTSILEVLSLNDSLLGPNPIISGEKYKRVEILGSCINLLNLDISSTEFTDYCLEYVCNHLEKLEKVNFSKTLITNLNPITKLKNLKNLNCSYCQFSSTENCYKPIKELKNLQSINLTDIKIDNKFIFRVNKFLQSSIWPNLEFMEISNELLYANDEILK